MSHLNKFVSLVFGCLLAISGVIYLLDGIFHSHFAMMITEAVVSHGAVVLGIVFLFLGILILALNFLVKPQKTVKVPGAPSEKPVHVALSTIESMAKNAALAVPGVSNVSTKIKNSRRGLLLDVNIHMEYDDKITAITEQLQDDIKTLIESGTTVPVQSVRVTVIKAAGEKDAADYRSASQNRENQ
ncbi:MAG: alkaline shock response membrane anchor protein AmaP [Bacillota bacterium]|nr:alkaline shock response membrane anchor protein AmaP [Bacillota bacterium]